MATLITCSSCKNSAAFENVKYAQNGKDLVCLSCYHEPKERKEVVEREKFLCLSCNYKFTFKVNSRVARRCPYCSSDNIALPEKISSRAVLKDVTVNPEITYGR